MAKITLRPTSASGNNWNNIGNAYDGNESTNASVSVSLFSSPRTLTLNFDTSVIPSGATINSATLTLRSKAGKTTITARVDINGNSEHRVINQKQSTTITNYTADVTSYMSDLTSVEVSASNNSWSGNTFELYELWIDVDYTASTTYTVRFLDWDNSVISTQTVTSGGSATAPSNPTRDGYVFTGWDKSFTNITANTDIHAQYTIKTYTVRFLDWNDTVLDTQTINHGSSATPPPNPTRDGYTFTGWSGDYTNVTANVDIIAQYTQNSSGEVDTSVKNIKLGSSTIDKLYLGTSQILKAYLGSILLYSYSNGGTGGGDTPVIGDNYQLYTGYPLIVENSSLDANYGSYITEIVGNTTQGVSNEVTSQQIVDSINYYVPNIAEVNDDGTITTLKATIDRNDITDDTHFIQLKPNTTYIFYCKRIETGGNPSMLVFLGGEAPSSNEEWLKMTTEGVVLTTNDTGKVLIWIPSAQAGLLNIIVQEGTSLSLESSIRSVGVLQGDGTYKVDIIASNQNGSQTQTKSIYLPQPLRMVRGYSDRLYWDDTLGKYCIEQNVCIFKMSEFSDSITSQGDGLELCVGYIGKSHNMNTTYCDFCNILPSYQIDWSFPNEGIYYEGGAVMYIAVSKDKASNMTELKQWCINNNFTCHVRYNTPVIVETDITDKILFNTYANYTKVITDEKEVAPISMSGNFASSNLWDGVSYLPGRVDDNPTWGEYDGGYTDNWSLIDPYGIQFDITDSSMRGFTLQFENLTSGKYLNFTAISNQKVYKYPEINFYFFDSSKTYLNKVRTGISSDGIEAEVILTNGEMSASVLIPDNATCCEMTFKLTIDTPTPYHIEITNINVIEEYVSKNLFNKATAKLNTIASAQEAGYELEFGTYEGYFSSDYIEAKPNTEYVISDNGVKTDYVIVYFIDENKKVLDGTDINPFTTLSGTKYIMFCELMDKIDTIQLEEGSTPTDYEPY